MRTHRLTTLVGTSAALAGAGAAIALAASPAKITPSGVDGVKLGSTFTSLRQQGLVGKIKHGCELGGPNTRGARLSAPLKGSVNLTQSHPRRVTDITVEGGAKARGVGIGATISKIKAAFPKAQVDHSTDSTFALTMVRIPKGGGGKLTFGVSTKSHKTTLIGIPFIAVCD
ncbi:MAG: hypothetical protein QOF55_2376 [Thermoleophilaceae bacterium]|jgi:hypothetical protein|nr:hypothetical protein [Thermoleophilaceae bacterium]